MTMRPCLPHAQAVHVNSQMQPATPVVVVVMMNGKSSCMTQPIEPQLQQLPWQCLSCKLV